VTTPHYRLKNAYLEPKPVHGRLPLLIGGAGEQVTLRIVARWADEWNLWGTPDVVAAKSSVLERHCSGIDRDPSTICRLAQVIVDLEGHGLPMTRRLPTVAVKVAEMQSCLAAYADAGLTEFVLPDWNLGTGAARRDALDLFIEEVAAPFRAV
jgi:hypothetical protein